MELRAPTGVKGTPFHRVALIGASLDSTASGTRRR